MKYSAKGRSAQAVPSRMFTLQKGITPVISVVLLLLITIAIIGIAFSWFMSTSQYTMKETENATKTQTAKLSMDFRVEASSGNNIYIRNIGKNEITKHAFSVFLNNNRLDEADIIMEPIPAGKIGTLVINQSLEPEDVIDIYGPITHETITISGTTTVTTTTIYPHESDIAGMWHLDSGAEELSPSESLGTGLVGLWHLNEASGNAIDSSGNGNDGTVTGATRGVGGKFKTGYDFDGVDDYVNVLDSISLSPTSEITISVWVKVSDISIANRNAIVSKWDATNNKRSYILIINDAGTGKISLGISSVGSNYKTVTTNSTVITDNKWHHVAGLWENGIFKIYVDGNLKPTSVWAESGTTPDSIYDSNVRVGIGDAVAWSGERAFFNGTIDEVAIWNRSLSADEVRELYEKGIAKGYSSNKNNGTTISVHSTPSGKLETAYDFDGTDDYIEVDHDSSLDFANVNFTVVSWVKLEATGGLQTLMMKKADNETKSDAFSNYNLYAQSENCANENQIAFQAGNESTYGFVCSDGKITDTNWHYLGFIFDASTNEVNFYIDGQLDSTKSFTVDPAINDDPLFIGKHTDANNNDGLYFNGTIDEVVIWNRALTESEIQEIYNNQK